MFAQLNRVRQLFAVLVIALACSGLAQAQKWVKLAPFHGFKVDLSIEFNHPVFERSAQAVSLSPSLPGAM